MTLMDFFEKCKDITSGWILASLTDNYIVGKWEEFDKSVIDETKVLEIRVFNRDCEHRLSRSSINRNLVERTITDAGRDENTYYDELQYLDIDTSKGEIDGKVVATSGRKYTKPTDNIKDAKVRIRYYLGKYEETGQARIEDWRVVEFI